MFKIDDLQVQTYEHEANIEKVDESSSMFDSRGGECEFEDETPRQ